MTHDDWHDEDLRAFGYLLRGMNLAPDAKGQPRPDDSFLVLMNQGESPVEFALPTKTNELDDKSCTAWHVVPEVAGDLEGTGPFEPGSVFALQPHRLVAFRAERE
jgi:glycogen operon protein